MDKMRLVFPPLPAASLALLLYSVYCLFMPYTMALAVFAGSISGYIVYDMIHYYLHHGTPYGSYFRALKRYHVKHHYLDQQKGEWSLLCKENVSNWVSSLSGPRKKWVWVVSLVWKNILMNLYKLGVPECVSVRTMLLIFKHYFILKLKLNVADVNEMSTIDRKNFFMSNLVHV